MKKLFALSIGAIFIFFPLVTLAMGSANYKIDVDVINSGGGDSSSANFSTSDSIGESFVGTGSSANYAVGEGFEASLVFGISLSLDSATKNLGAGAPGAQLTGTTVATVTTDAWGGYDLYISKDKELTHTDTVSTISSIACTIASPCLWPGSGFGFTVKTGTSVEPKWYTNPNYYYAAIPNSSTVFHTKEGYTSGGNDTTIEYKADIGWQKTGLYANTVTYTAVAKL
jgi:hypothetical protein